MNLVVRAIASLSFLLPLNMATPTTPPPIPIDHDGQWSLSDLGATHTLKIESGHPGGKPVTTEVHYSLPGKASQGPEHWYTTDLHASVQFSADARGDFELTAGNNGFVAASIQLSVDRTGVVQVGTLSLIGGSRNTSHTGGRATVDSSNYQQQNGVRPNSNTLTYGISALDGSVGRAIALIALSSGTTRTAISPYETGVAGPSSIIKAVTGESFSIPFKLARAGGRSDGLTTAALINVPPAVHVNGTMTQAFRSVGTGTVGHFSARADTPGTYVIVLTAQGDYNKSATQVTVQVGQPQEKSSIARWVGFAALFVLLLIVLLHAVGRLHNRNGTPS